MQCMLQSEYCGVWHHIKVEALSSVFYLKCLQNCRKDKWQAQNYYHLNFMFPQVTFINILLRLDQMHCWLNTACRPQICHPVLSMYTVFVWSGGCLGGRKGPGSVMCCNSQYASAIMCLIKHCSCQYTYQMYSFTVARKQLPTAVLYWYGWCVLHIMQLMVRRGFHYFKQSCQYYKKFVKLWVVKLY